MNDQQWAALAGALSQPNPAYLTASVSVSNNDFRVTMSWTPNANPGAVWTRTGTGLALSYQSNSYDSGNGFMHLSSANATNNYGVTGTLTVGADGKTITIQTHTICYAEGNLHKFGANVASGSANILDEVWTAIYAIAPSERPGGVIVTLTSEKPVSQRDPVLEIPQLGMVASIGGTAAQAAPQASLASFSAAIAQALNASGGMPAPPTPAPAPSPSPHDGAPHALIPPGGGPGPQPHHTPIVPHQPHK